MSPPPVVTRPRKRASRSPPEPDEPLPLVEIVLNGVDASDWVTETLTAQGVNVRLLGCRPTDRSRRRLLRLFEVQTKGEAIAPILRRLRSRLSARDIGVASLGADRALVRASVPMPAGCSTAFELGDFCIGCRFLATPEGTSRSSWKVLVPRLEDARRLLRSVHTKGGAHPSLVRAGAYRRRGGLTGRQERAIRVAFDQGYFDYPRRTSLSAVAARLGVSRSTTLELLRKATTKLAAERFLAEPSINRPF